jgi:ferredoxin
VAIYDQIKTRIERARASGQEPNPLFVEGLDRYQAMVDRAQGFIERHGLGSRPEIQSAAIRFCLDSPDVHTVCFIARTYDEMGAFLRLSGQRLDAAAGGRLEAYREGCGGLYCRHACGLCEPSCPHGVPVNTIARYFQYHAGQGRTREAADLYAAIPGPAGDLCRDCPGSCEKACPYGVPVQGLMILAHQALAQA